jgi:ribonuclease HII
VINQLSLIAGVDEAGRGAVIGPLVISAFAIDAENVKMLRELGVRDSKLLSSKARVSIYNELLRIADACSIRIAEPRVIDRYVSGRALNILEAEMFASAIAEVKPSLAYMDACDIDVDRFSRRVAEMLSRYRLADNVMLSSSHKADSKSLVVGAASIIAKVTRDNAIKELKSIYGNIGSGYPSDRVTMEFINRLVSRGITAEFVRYSWRPVKRMIAIKSMQNNFYYLPYYY